MVGFHFNQSFFAMSDFFVFACATNFLSIEVPFRTQKKPDFGISTLMKETFHCEAVDAIFWPETKPV